MTLRELLTNVEVQDISGNTDLEIPGIRFDSRTVETGDLFVAIKGASANGHQFIESAIEKGAAAIVYDQSVVEFPQTTVTKIRVDDSAKALGIMASAFFHNPSEQLTIVGITGTNGKTTSATLLWQLFSRLGYKCGLIGTVENRIGDTILGSTHTTPDALKIQELLSQMSNAGCAYVFMEVSSHAIEQRRIAGIKFTGGVFTNLTHEHLDYHKTFADYRDAKKKFFDELPAEAFALINNDEKNGPFMLQNTVARKYSYGLKKAADFKSKIIANTLNGLHLQMDGTEMFARMIGEFNAYNLTSAYAVASLLGIEKMETLTVLSDLIGAEGRFDRIAHPHKKDCIAIVDYAHTPDALEKVLETIEKLKSKNSRVITVTGAGGDRDKSKRPEMARISARFSDHLILTSDNPRTEDPMQILRDMLAGLNEKEQSKTLVIADREQAIKTATMLAKPADVILVAGKGHEKYQEINGVKYPFDDKQVLINLMDYDK